MKPLLIAVLIGLCVTPLLAQPGSGAGGFGSVGPGGGGGGPTNGQTAVQVGAAILNSAILKTNGTGSGTTLTATKFPAVTNDFWVSTSGSDSNPGNFSSPFATATNAIAAVPAGNASVIHFGPGTFNCGTNQLTMASNMKLMGSGKFATILLSTAFGATNPHHFILFPPMNGEISDLTVTNNQAAYCLLGGGDDGHVNSFTNTVIRNTAWYGYSDIFATEGNNGPSSMDVYDSYLYTYEDVTISGGTSGGGGDPAGSTNNVMRFHNCDITSNPTNATSSPNGLSSAVGLVWAEGCNIHPIKTNGTIYAIGIVSTGLGYGRLDNCLLAESGTNADSDFHCVKTPKSPYLIINNCRRSDGGPLNGNGYFYDGNGVQVSGTNSVSYGYGYTNVAPNAVAIGNSTATLTFSNGVIGGVGVFTGDGSGLTNVGSGSQTPWTSTINAAQHTLSNLGHLQLTNSAGTGSFLDLLLGQSAYGTGIGVTSASTNSGVAASSYAQFDNLVANTKVVSPSYIGDGSSLSNLNGANLQAGTVTGAALASPLSVTQLNAGTAWVTNSVTPTNSFAGTTVDFSKAESRTNLGGNLTFTAVANVTAGAMNSCIITMGANGADRTIAFPASFHAGRNNTLVVTNGTESEFLFRLQPGIRTNVYQLDTL